MKALVVEDEKKVASFIKKGLEGEDFLVDVANDGKSGLDLAYDDVYDIIILDIMLPEMDGLTLLQKLRHVEIVTPVLLLTAKSNIESKVTGLNLGADDYLVKPFAFEELLARVRALIRRNQPQKNSIIKYDNLSIDLMSHEIKRDGNIIDLSAKEYSLLVFLVHNAGRVLNRATIAEHVWQDDFDRGTNFIDVYINRLRTKIDFEGQKKFITTVRGYGYKFQP